MNEVVRYNGREVMRHIAMFALSLPKTTAQAKTKIDPQKHAQYKRQAMPGVAQFAASLK